MTVGVWILGDQLHFQQAALLSIQGKRDVPILMVECESWARQRNYHKQKLILVWSAMRHFADELRAAGFAVTYSEADEFTLPVQDFVRQRDLKELRVMVPADIPFRDKLARLDVGCTIELVPDNHFMWGVTEFNDWADGSKRLVMEDFYRFGRKRFNILMDGDAPEGGRWNFDKDNRKPPKTGLAYPEALTFEPDEITNQVIDKVTTHFSENFGSASQFGWGVTRSEAIAALEHFVTVRLSQFGPYQDAMVTGQDTMWHALLSPYLNLGLLRPHEVVNAAQAAYVRGEAPLASVEGSIRQVMGWREYVRGLYERLMPTGYAELNFFQHHRPLPQFFWTADVDMNCLRQVLDQVHRTGYAHHIQRLMVLGNFALISGIDPQEMESWFHSAFVDATDWVMQPNVIGMSLYADGGKLATKPYAASGKYIRKMSDYCCRCTYNPEQRTGPEACPFNVFYWHFLHFHRPLLSNLGRMGLVLSHLKRFSSEELSAVTDTVGQWWDMYGT